LKHSSEKPEKPTKPGKKSWIYKIAAVLLFVLRQNVPVRLDMSDGHYFIVGKLW